MVLHFTDGTSHLNVCTNFCRYNLNFYPDRHYINVSTDDLDVIWGEIQFNCYGCYDDLFREEIEND